MFNVRTKSKTAKTSRMDLPDLQSQIQAFKATQGSNVSCQTRLPEVRAIEQWQQIRDYTEEKIQPQTKPTDKPKTEPWVFYTSTKLSCPNNEDISARNNYVIEKCNQCGAVLHITNVKP